MFQPILMLRRSSPFAQCWLGVGTIKCHLKPFQGQGKSQIKAEIWLSFLKETPKNTAESLINLILNGKRRKKICLVSTRSTLSGRYISNFLFTYGEEGRCCPLKCKFTLLTLEVLTLEVAQPCVGDSSHLWQTLFQTSRYDVHTSCSSIPRAALGMAMRGGGQPTEKVSVSWCVSYLKDQTRRRDRTEPGDCLVSPGIKNYKKSRSIIIDKNLIQNWIRM